MFRDAFTDGSNLRGDRRARSGRPLTDSRENEPRTSVRAVFHAGGGVIFVRCSARAKARGSMGLRMFRPTESVSLSKRGAPIAITAGEDAGRYVRREILLPEKVRR